MIEREIVESAKILGNLINRAAHMIADSKVKCCLSAEEREKEVNQEKIMTLNRFENVLMRVKTPQGLVFRVSSFVSKNLEVDLPREVKPLFEETLVGEKLRLKDAVFLLVGFMRLSEREETAANIYRVE